MIVHVSVYVILTYTFTYAFTVVPTTPSDGYPLRLGGYGADETGGRVEMQVRGEWAKVCGDGIGIDVIKVMCRQIGVEPSATKKLDGTVKYRITAWLVSIDCMGSESKLHDCYVSQVSEGSCYSPLSIECVSGYKNPPRTSLTGPLVGGITGGCVLIMLGPLACIFICQRCKKKKYPAPTTNGGRAPVGRQVDRLGGNFPPHASVDPDPFPFLYHSRQAASKPTTAYIAPHASYEMRPVMSQQTAYRIPSISEHYTDRTPNTSPTSFDTAPSIVEDPPKYDDIFPSEQKDSEFHTSQV